MAENDDDNEDVDTQMDHNIDDSNVNADAEMDPHFDSANYPPHFDAWDEFHTDVDVDIRALSDEEERDWNE